MNPIPMANFSNSRHFSEVILSAFRSSCSFCCLSLTAFFGLALEAGGVLVLDLELEDEVEASLVALEAAFSGGRPLGLLEAGFSVVSGLSASATSCAERRSMEEGETGETLVR